MFGDGPVDLVFVHRFVSTIGYFWDIPLYSRFLKGLGETARVLALDPRGSGLSDRDFPPKALTLEARTLDIHAVMDAEGWETASLLGAEDGGSLGALYAATYPQRVDRLILHSTYACGLLLDDYPWGWTAEEWDIHLKEVDESWGKSEGWLNDQVKWIAKSSAGDEDAIRRIVNMYQLGAPPKIAREVFEIQRDLDIRSILPLIQAPTLIIHPENSIEPREQAPYMADRIPGARWVEVPGADFEIYSGNAEGVLGEIEEFLTGTRHTPDSNRVLATVLFTDIVDSTSKAATLGDHRWRETREAHDRAVRSSLARFRGREIKTMGDGFLATFDGPARAVRCAAEISVAMGPLGIEIRAGLHTGEIELEGSDVTGLAVAIASRVATLAGPSEILASSTVKDLTAGSGLVFEDAGEHELKGVPDRWRLYRVVDRGLDLR
jgi:class 3 adenylate cyclase/pimeloyl-ACP methyl ester carboxylesterase